MFVYVKSVRRFWGTALAWQLEYKVNFIIEIASMLLSLTGSLFTLSLFFKTGFELGGWSWQEALIVQGFYTIFDGITTTLLRPNLGSIVKHVREGTLDYVLLKPIDSQVWLSLRTLSPAGLPEIVLGILIITWASKQLNIQPTISTLIIGSMLLIIGTIILYSLWFLIASSSIWFVKIWNATEVLRAILASGRYPINAYPNSLQTIFTLIIPVAFLTTVPAELLLGKLQIQNIVLAGFISILFFGAARAFWLYALRSYTSASS